MDDVSDIPAWAAPRCRHLWQLLSEVLEAHGKRFSVEMQRLIAAGAYNKLDKRYVFVAPAIGPIQSRNMIDTPNSRVVPKNLLVSAMRAVS